MTINTSQEPEIIIKKTGEIIFWHEEMINLIHKLIRSRKINASLPQAIAHFYLYIGFEPTFYSVHTLEINRRDIQGIVFTNVSKERAFKHHVMVLSKTLGGYMKKESRMLLEKNLTQSIEEGVVRSLEGKDLFSQTAISISLSGANQ